MFYRRYDTSTRTPTGVSKDLPVPLMAHERQGRKRCVQDGGNKDAAAPHRAVTLALLWSSHCRAGIGGLNRPIPDYQTKPAVFCGPRVRAEEAAIKPKQQSRPDCSGLEAGAWDAVVRITSCASHVRITCSLTCSRAFAAVALSFVTRHIYTYIYIYIYFYIT